MELGKMTDALDMESEPRNIQDPISLVLPLISLHINLSPPKKEKEHSTKQVVDTQRKIDRKITRQIGSIQPSI